MESDVEIWKSIPGYEGFYEASNLGRVRSVDCIRVYKASGKTVCRKHKGKVLTPCFDGQKHYLHVAIASDNSKAKSVQVHRLIAQTFVDNPLSLPEVNHIDEDKTNNRADNLEWCDHAYNNRYGSKANASNGEHNGMARLDADTVRAIRAEYIPYDAERGITGLARKYGISVVHAFQIVNRTRWRWLD